MANTELCKENVLAFRQHVCSIDVLTRLGFSFSCEEKIASTKASPESYKICLVGAGSRSIDFVFYPLPGDQGILLVYINNLDAGQALNLKDWLKAHGHLREINAFKLGAYSGDLDEKWKGLSRYLSDIFSDPELSSILKGNKWEYIPFDWKGIK